MRAEEDTAYGAIFYDYLGAESWVTVEDYDPAVDIVVVDVEAEPEIADIVVEDWADGGGADVFFQGHLFAKITGGAGISFVATEGGFQSETPPVAAGYDQILIGTEGPDFLYGGEGDDFIDGVDKVPFGTRYGVDTLKGEGGNDTMLSGDAGAIMDGGEGDDHMTLEGGTGLLYGRTGDDVLLVLDGDARISGGAGADVLENRGVGDVTAFYTGKVGGEIDLAGGTASGGDAEGDTLIGIRDVTGGASAQDVSRGDDGSNTLNGGPSEAGSLDRDADEVFGAGGDDRLIGGRWDRLSGGEGVDSFETFYDLDAEGAWIGAGNEDQIDGAPWLTITDFDAAVETLQIEVRSSYGDHSGGYYSPDVVVRVEDWADGSGASVTANGALVAKIVGGAGMDVPTLTYADSYV